jgi:hypothetical protein
MLTPTTPPPVITTCALAGSRCRTVICTLLPPVTGLENGGRASTVQSRAFKTSLLEQLPEQRRHRHVPPTAEAQRVPVWHCGSGSWAPAGRRHRVPKPPPSAAACRRLR